MDVQQDLKQKERELAIAQARIRELQEAYQVQTQDLLYWRHRAAQLQNAVQGLQAQLESAHQQIARLRRQRKWLIGGGILGAATAILFLATQE